MLRFFGVAALAMLAAACVTSITSDYDKPDGKNLVVSKEDWNGFQTYLGKVGGIGQGAFAVTVENGRTVGYDYVDCPSTTCTFGKAFPNDAMDRCKSHGGTCILFASGRDIRVNYSLAQ
jgi:hypothetical protein